MSPVTVFRNCSVIDVSHWHHFQLYGNVKRYKPHTQKSLESVFSRPLLQYYTGLNEVRVELELCQNWSLILNFSAVGLRKLRPISAQNLRSASQSESFKVLNGKLNISWQQPSVDKSVQVNRKSPKFNLLPENLFLELDIRLGFVCSMSIMPVQF